jgi:hypothetical protein
VTDTRSGTRRLSVEDELGASLGAASPSIVGLVRFREEPGELLGKPLDDDNVATLGEPLSVRLGSAIVGELGRALG